MMEAIPTIELKHDKINLVKPNVFLNHRQIIFAGELGKIHRLDSQAIESRRLNVQSICSFSNFSNRCSSVAAGNEQNADNTGQS